MRPLAESFPALAVIIDSQGQTPLHVAAYFAHEPAIQALLDLTPQIATSVDSSGRTPLYAAAAGMSFKEHQVAALRMLFEAAPVAARMQDSSGCTPLELLLADPYNYAAAQDLGVRDPQATLLLLRASHQPAGPALAAHLAACLPLSAFERASLPAACLAGAEPQAHQPRRGSVVKSGSCTVP